MKKLFILSFALAAFGCTKTPAQVAVELSISEAAVLLAIDHFSTAELGASYSPSGSQYVNNLFGNVNPVGVQVNLGLPNYTYFQGLVVSRQHVFLAGQVRVVGGVVANGNAVVSRAGMVTTNPESQLGRVNVGQARWKVEAWVQE